MLRGLDLEGGAGGWAVTALGAAVLVLPSAGWRIPDEQGMPYPMAFGMGAAAAIAGLGVVALVSRRRMQPLEVL
ncbi:MAG: hypothetical protein ABIV26_03755, partial [Candidatus Limnocylindrales bacterium]